nr:unnamed protein product [Digitaria exilis]
MVSSSSHSLALVGASLDATLVSASAAGVAASSSVVVAMAVVAAMDVVVATVTSMVVVVTSPFLVTASATTTLVMEKEGYHLHQAQASGLDLHDRQHRHQAAPLVPPPSALARRRHHTPTALFSLDREPGHRLVFQRQLHQSQCLFAVL